jgi:hypothetical protein
MSEQAPERGQPDGAGRGRPGQGKKILGMSRGQAIGLGVVALAGVGYLLWRARKNAQAAAQQQSTAGTCPDGSSPDANGNCPQNGQDWSGAIDTLQSEIADLQGALAGAGAGAGGGGAAGAGSVGAATGTTTAPPTTAPVTTGSAPATQAKPAATAGPISGLTATQTGTTSFTVRWNPATNATGGYAYIVRDLATHQQVGQPHNTKSTSATVTGLKSKTDYNFGIQALPGGAGDNLHVRTK